MTDAIDPDSDIPRESTAKDQEIESLNETIHILELQLEEVQDKLLDSNAENNKFKQRLERLTRENEKLKQNPVFVATVQEIFPSDNEVLLKQHGNNQEAIAEVTPQMLSELQPNDRVAINNSLSITKRLEKEIDARAGAMEVIESPDASYADIGGLSDEITEVRESVELALDQPELFDTVGIQPPSGVLLYGPPGTGKTMLAKAVAAESNANFIRLSGSELVQKFIGEGAKLVRNLFDLARNNEPAVIFIDEIDAIAGKRTESKTTGDSEVQRTMMQLLSEMDGFEDRGDIRIIAATNRRDMLDDAIVRPGRFDRLIEIGAPDNGAREEIFRIHTERMNLVDSLDYNALATQTSGMTGADINAICTEAGMFAIRNNRVEVTHDDFDAAIQKVEQSKADKPSHSPDSDITFA